LKGAPFANPIVTYIILQSANMPPKRRIKKATKEGTNEENEKKKNFKEPKIKWRNSKAKRLLYQAMMDGRVTLDKDDLGDGGEKMTLRAIYVLEAEFAEYNYDKFSHRVSSLRKTITDAESRAEQDQEAYDNFTASHPPSLYSHKGYMQWQGSDAQKQAIEDIKKGLHKSMAKFDLWQKRDVYYENFPLKEWRDKLNQEIGTAKYLHTLRVRGKLHKAS
jgi:hypothetical protein